jgi:hypothetical protein
MLTDKPADKDLPLEALRHWVPLFAIHKACISTICEALPGRSATKPTEFVNLRGPLTPSDTQRLAVI